MAALTENLPQWQPGNSICFFSFFISLSLTFSCCKLCLGFESVDTSIRGVISLNGILDLQSDQDRMMYFTQKVAGQDSIDLAFLGRHSPLHVVKHQGCGVPFLVLAGDRDMMVDTSIATRFKVALDDQGKDSGVCKDGRLYSSLFSFCNRIHSMYLGGDTGK
jgi:hypothetical protein